MGRAALLMGFLIGFLAGAGSAVAWTTPSGVTRLLEGWTMVCECESTFSEWTQDCTPVLYLDDREVHCSAVKFR